MERTLGSLLFVTVCLSLTASGQQPSPDMHAVWRAYVHIALHVEAAPESVSVVQAVPSLQLAGQLPSQVSCAST